MGNGQRNIKQKSTILAIILVIYVYVPYFMNILENTFKISSLLEYVIYMMLAMIAIGTTMSMNKRVFTFLFVFCSVIIINYIDKRAGHRTREKPDGLCQREIQRLL